MMTDMDFENIAVIGLGTIGRAVAAHFAGFGYSVTAYDIDPVAALIEREVLMVVFSMLADSLEAVPTTTTSPNCIGALCRAISPMSSAFPLNDIAICRDV